MNNDFLKEKEKEKDQKIIMVTRDALIDMFLESKKVFPERYGDMTFEQYLILYNGLLTSKMVKTCTDNNINIDDVLKVF